MSIKIKRKTIGRIALAVFAVLAISLAAKATGSRPFGYQLMAGSPTPLAEGVTVLSPTTGSVRYSGGGATLDASNTAEGYVMVRYKGSTRSKVRITRTGGTTYTYDLRSDGVYEVFPLTDGSGDYQVQVFYNLSGSQYALALSQNITVRLRSHMLPYLYPNQLVNFTASSKAVAKGAELAEGAEDDIAIVTAIYNYVTQTIRYDTQRAKQVTDGSLVGYIPVVDDVLANQKGICFDYAALMAAMLRSQQIPTRMEFGYVSGGIYHAWISTYITGVGWLNGVIQFDGESWKLMDPTFASSGGGSTEILRFIGNGSNYKTAYVY
jgi:transglutaminase-like putative cysteine protease